MLNDIPSQSGFEDVFIAFTLFSFRLVSHDLPLNTNHIMLNMRSTKHVHSRKHVYTTKQNNYIF